MYLGLRVGVVCSGGIGMFGANFDCLYVDRGFGEFVVFWVLFGC